MTRGVVQTVLIVLAGLAVLGVLAFAALLFHLTGGWGRIVAEQAVANRGFKATELHAVDGLWRMQLPASWQRDAEPGHSSGAVRFGPDPASESRPGAAQPEHAQVRYSLGRFAHAGGAISSGVLDIYVPVPGAPAFDIDTTTDFGVRWRAYHRDDSRVWYVVATASEADLELGIWVIYHDLRSGVRVELKTSGDIYSMAQVLPLLREIADSVQVDAEALQAALAQHQRVIGPATGLQP